MKRAICLGLALIVGIASANSASASFVFTTPTGSTVVDGSNNRPVSAQAVFTINSGSVTIVLKNLLTSGNGTWFDRQLLSGLTFSVTDAASGTGSLTTVNSGAIATIALNGSYMLGNASDPLSRWTASHTDGAVDLNLFSGGQPDHQIIGPDSLGGFDGSGTYSPINQNIPNQFQPIVLGSATFTITIAGVGSMSQISNVNFRFGTDSTPLRVQGSPPGTINNQGGPVAPEPTSLALAGFAGIGMAIGALRRRRLQSQAA